MLERQLPSLREKRKCDKLTKKSGPCHRNLISFEPKLQGEKRHSLYNVVDKGQTDRSGELPETRMGASSFTGSEMTDHVTSQTSLHHCFSTGKTLKTSTVCNLEHSLDSKSLLEREMRSMKLGHCSILQWLRGFV